MLLPPKVAKKKKNTTRKTGRRVLTVSDSSSDTSAGEGASGGSHRPDGIEPPKDDQVDIDVWEERTGRVLDENDVDEVAKLVTWCFVSFSPMPSAYSELMSHTGQMG
jgi:hypothetical protein